MGLKILLIDDDPTTHELVGGMLRRYAADRHLPVEIIATADPVEGLFEATAHGEAFDLILLDVRMPRMTGDEIYNSLLHVDPPTAKRVLFITGYRDDLCNLPGGQPPHILDKPFDYEALAAAINAMIPAHH